jgi:hypothetical protein
VTIKHRKPLGALYTAIRFQQGRPVAHEHGCSCKVVHRYKCGVCGRVRGWCLGAHDNMPQACDFCWEPRQPPQLLDEHAA